MIDPNTMKLCVRRKSSLRECMKACLLAGVMLRTAAWGAVDAPPVFSKGPYLQAPGAETMTVLWESATNAPATVRYGVGRRLDRQVAAPPPALLQGVSSHQVSTVAAGKTNVVTVKTTNVCFVYSVTLTGLRPSTDHSYVVETCGTESRRRQFRTFGAAPEKVQFIAYGDSRSNPALHARVARLFRRYDPEFILHTGDLVARGRDYSLWSREFFDPLKDVIDRVPVLPALGNHEEDGTNYFAYFHLPEPERWYSFDVGPVHVLALDYHFEKASDEQFAFAQRDLMASRAPWKIVFLHYPVFNIGGHRTAWGHDTYLPLFHQGGVDLVLGGHSHVYERFRPVAPGAGASSTGIVHITTGGGGAPLYAVEDHPALAVKASTNHFVVFEATPDRLRGRAITARGKVLDRFELRKDAAQRSLDHRLAMYPEEALKLWFEAGSELAPRLASKPAHGEPAWVLFRLRPWKNSTMPATLDLSLAPESVLHYQLGVPELRIENPGHGGEERNFWTQVRLVAGRTASTNSSGELSPPLIFQARVRNAEFDVTTRTIRARVSAAVAKALEGSGGPIR